MGNGVVEWWSGGVVGEGLGTNREGTLGRQETPAFARKPASAVAGKVDIAGQAGPASRAADNKTL
jgi:hypothetical protein